MRLLLQASTDAAELPSGYGVSLLQTLLALAAVCVLAWAALRWAAQRGLGLGARGRMRVLERVPLSARHTLWLVKVGTKVLVIGTGDGASPTTLHELSESELPDAEADKSASFVEVLRRGASSRADTARRAEPRSVPPQDEPRSPPT